MKGRDYKHKIELNIIKNKLLEKGKIDEYARKLNNWKIIKNHHIVKIFDFDSYEQALNFVNEVAKIAENKNHHPDILLSYKKVKIKIFTHETDGLTKKDFELASEINY